MSKIPGRVPQPAQGTAEAAQVEIQRGLAARTLDKLDDYYASLGADVSARNEPAALALLEEAFAEANCHATLYDCTFWDLAGHSRLRGTAPSGEEVTIPCTELPKPGTIISWNGLTYYIGSHKNV